LSQLFLMVPQGKVVLDEIREESAHVNTMAKGF
jgi:hypothetical protein